jgi:hypothetical protein
MQAKTKAGPHAVDFDGAKYVRETWEPAPFHWGGMKNFHPIWPEVWPALRPVKLKSLGLPPSVEELAREEIEQLKKDLFPDSSEGRAT